MGTRQSVRPTLSIIAATATLIAIAPVSSWAAGAPVYGGPTYTPGVGGFKGERDGWITFNNMFSTVNEAGTAAGTVTKFDAAGTNLGTRAFRWDASGAPPVELGYLATYDHHDQDGTPIPGYTTVGVSAINNAGTVVGWAANRVGYANPVRWDASGTAATALQRLDHVYPQDSGFYSQVTAINDAGTAVGFSELYLGDLAIHGRATRWDASGIAVTALSHFDASNSDSIAVAINGAGTIVGHDSGNYRLLRWNAPDGPPEILGDGLPRALNDAGAVVGTTFVADTGYGSTAVRWDAAGTRTLLDGLEPKVPGDVYAWAYAVDINNAGTAVGYASLPGDNHQAAVRWDAGVVAPTVLDTVDTLDDSYTWYVARFINESGAIVGRVDNFIEPGRAVYWSPDGAAIDLNTLIDPAGGWTLNEVQGFSDTGWITGIGTFDPDGPGGQEAYARPFLMQVPTTAVPEPSGLALITPVVPALLRRRRDLAKPTS